MEIKNGLNLEWSLFRDGFIHEKHPFQNPWLLLGGGCYSEGSYWEGALYGET